MAHKETTKLLKNKSIVVNATACDRSGALSILKQFIRHIPNDGKNWLVFIPQNVVISTDNLQVRLVPIDMKSFSKRIHWDNSGLKSWLSEHKVEPIASISLQNTGFNVGKDVPSFIYYHQPIPFYPHKWDFFSPTERNLWLYKNIYPHFVKRGLSKDTHVLVQLDHIKDGFSKKFRHPRELIEVFSPDVELPTLQQPKEMQGNWLKLVYPASTSFYKNHRVLIKALQLTKRDLDLYLTVQKNSSTSLDRRVHCIGVQPYEKLCELYNTCDALLFPSYIETYGLPLIEAAMYGLPIIASDLPYSREVLEGYEGATFVKYDDPKAWAEAIQSLQKGKRYKPLDISKRPGWNDLFNYIFSIIENKTA